MNRTQAGILVMSSFFGASMARADTVTVHGTATTYTDFGLEPALLDTIGFVCPIGSNIDFTLVYDSTQYEGIGSLVVRCAGRSIDLPAPFRMRAGAQDDVTTSFGQLVDWFGAGTYAAYVGGGYVVATTDPYAGVRFQLGLIMADDQHSILPGQTAAQYLNDPSQW